MSTIVKVSGIEILDSRGNPTVEAEVFLADGSTGRAAVPSGASTGEHEAVELRDDEKNRYQGKGTRKAVANINGPIATALHGHDATLQAKIDQLMIDARRHAEQRQPRRERDPRRLHGGGARGRRIAAHAPLSLSRRREWLHAAGSADEHSQWRRARG